MNQHEVVIVGAGPTGLMLGAELTLAGVDVVVLERRHDQTVVGLRALGVHARTLELLAQRGVAERFVAQGMAVKFTLFGGMSFDVSDLPSRFPPVLALPQQQFENLLAAWLEELGVVVKRGIEVATVSQDKDGVDVSLSNGTTLRARYLVGCDGGRSMIRKQSEIAFNGHDAAISYLLAEASTTNPPPYGFRRDVMGTQAIGPLAPAGSGRARFVIADDVVKHAEPDVDELKKALIRVYGDDFGVHDVTWISRFSDAARVAAAYRKGRVFLAGDAAHVHSPVGGQGLNLGLQDAVNLGWKLARVIHGTAPESLLDTYFSEQEPLAQRVVRTTLGQTALGRGDDRTNALREVLADLLTAPDARRRTTAMMTGLDIRYAIDDVDMTTAHPLLGRRMPDIDILVGGAPRTVFSLLHRLPKARSVLLHLGATSTEPLEPSAFDADVVHARAVGELDVPTVGLIATPRAVLIRPDGHVAWVS